MPMIQTRVSVELTKEKETMLKTKLGEAISLLPGKSERYLMLEFEDRCRLWFHGENAAPLAFVEVKIFGRANREAYCALTDKICSILKEVLEIEPENVYVKYEEVEHWGWNGTNF